MIEYSEIKDALQSFDANTPDKLKRYIHYRSFKNFVTHFDEVREDKTKSYVLGLLSDYVDDVRNREDHDFSAPTDWKRLAKAYLNPLSRIYTKGHGFVTSISLLWAVIIGVIGDAILYVLQSLFHF